MRIIVGTRGSKLALYNTDRVIEALKKFCPGIQVVKKIIKSYGDIDNRNLQELEQRGIFTRALEEELLRNNIDMAIHSFKDLPLDIPEQLEIVGTLPREYVWDIVITRDGDRLAELPEYSVVGTGSQRRIFQIAHYFENKKFVFKNIRGNIDTRIRKVGSGEYDAIVISGASIPILENVKYEKIDYDIILPAPAQSAICFQIKKDNKKLSDLLRLICDKKSFFECKMEREVLRVFGGGCFNKIGCRYFYDDKLLIIRMQEENKKEIKNFSLRVETIEDLYRQLKVKR